jgi:hypothetical protein
MAALREVARSHWTGGARGYAHVHYAIAKYFTYTVPLQVTHVLCVCA